MKIKVMSRSLDDHLPQSVGAPAPLHKNLDPSLHPHIRSREYTRAVQAAKLNRMFAKPFLGQLEGHRDGVYAMTKDPKALGRIATGGGDGEVRLWELGGQTCVMAMPDAHRGRVGGLAFLPARVAGEGRSRTYDQAEASSSRRKVEDYEDEMMDETMDVDDEKAGLEREEDALAAEEARSARLGSRKLLSCGSDKVVKLWDVGRASEGGKDDRLVATYDGRHGFNAIDHHRTDPFFVTASDRIHLWDVNKSSPIMDLSWDSSRSRGSSSKKADSAFSGEHIVSVVFSPSETTLLASSGSDRSICLYDVRQQKALGRVIMNMRVNSLRFNPMQPAVLLAGSEDHQAYTFDVRNLSTATQVYKDHVAAVMSVDWSPTGREFVSGSYDRTVRLWSQSHGRSKDVYHTKRMQRVFSTVYTLDARFVVTGSDDGGVRVWKARAGESLKVMSGREKAKREYGEELRRKWKNVEGVGKLERQRYLPKSIYSAQKLRTEMLASRAKKEDNRRAHRKRGEAETNPKSERKKWITRVQE